MRSEFSRTGTSVVALNFATWAATLAVTLRRSREAPGASTPTGQASSESSDPTEPGGPSATATNDSSPFQLSVNMVTGWLTVLGFAFFAQSYVMALAFYSQFGLTPEDVGWSQTRAIARSAVVSGAFAIVLGLALLSSILVARLARAVLARRSAETAGGLTSVWWPRVALTLIIVGGLWFIATSLYTSNTSVRKAANDVRTVKDPAADAGFTAQMYGIDYSVGRATWSEPELDGRVTRVRTIGVLLGQANGTSIVYDLCTRAVLRLPTGSLILQERNLFAESGSDESPVTDQDRRSACQPLGRTVS